MQLQVTVNLLNKRYRVPAQLPEPSGIAGQVMLGYTFEGIEASPEDITNPAVETWYVDRDGYFYWGGGVKQVLEMAEISVPKTQAVFTLKQNSYFSKLDKIVNWNNRVSQIPNEWKETKGEGVKVAVIDTGVFQEHEDFAGAFIFFNDFTIVNDEIDYDGHGTHVSGLIGARSSTANGVIGIAPLAELIILKVLPDGKDGGDLENYQSIIDALDMAVQQGADIINMSLSLKLGSSPEENEKLRVKKVKEKIKEITDKKIIIAAAAGDNANLRGKKLFFPSECEGVISVASINEGYFDRNPDFSEFLNIAGPTINYISTYKSPLFYERFGGCSMTSACMSGIMALALSFMRNNNKERMSKAEMISLLHDHSLPLIDIQYSDDAQFYFHVLNH